MRESYGDRYQIPTGAESESEPGSKGLVLRNLQGIKRKREMDQAESEALVRAQTRYSSFFSDETRFTAELLCQMHREWLGELYEWAGQYRTVSVSKADFDGWPPPLYLDRGMSALESDFLREQTPCRPADLQTVSLGLAKVHAELLAIHPFREGNGRLGRWLADVMAQQAGFPPPDYPLAGRGIQAKRAAYFQAMRQGYLRRYDSLTFFFRAALTRGLDRSHKLL